MNIIQRLQKIMPENIKPIACSWEEHLAKMQKISEEASLQGSSLAAANRYRVEWWYLELLEII
ncbi:hypothetical protein [Arsenophonus sp. ENCA]|uniref:hypothetical protein n=1 Tax=Arsenophonus sp. ENCA TaxID=1987579 RepID=UPI0025BE93B9|nr:hypothetical protein [Arsenophonus sp. ENCA]